MLFNGYNPYSHHGTKPTEPPDVPLHVFKAAQRAGAMCLSADGRYCYTARYGEAFEAEWQGDGFGAWWPCGSDFPAGAVRM